MNDVLVVVVALGVGVPLLLALIIGIILFAGKSRPQPGLGPRPTPPGVQPADGTWNVMLMDGPTGVLGGTLGATSGTFHVQHGALSFLQDGSPMPQWSVPCPQVSVRVNSAFRTAGVELWTPRGHVRCDVSREHINRWTRNSITSLREPRWSREFQSVLVANGARPV